MAFPPATFVVRRGGVSIEAHPIVRNLLKAMAMRFEREDIAVTLTGYEPKASDAQRGTFWTWCEHVAAYVRAAGRPCSKEAVHDAVLAARYGKRDLGLGQWESMETLTRPHRKGKLAMIDLLTYMADEWAPTEIGIDLPRPETWDADVAELHKQQEELRLARQPA